MFFPCRKQSKGHACIPGCTSRLLPPLASFLPIVLPRPRIFDHPVGKVFTCLHIRCLTLFCLLAVALCLFIVYSVIPSAYPSGAGAVVWRGEVSRPRDQPRAAPRNITETEYIPMLRCGGRPYNVH